MVMLPYKTIGGGEDTRVGKMDVILTDSQLDR